jgi:hypothetical protein
MEAFVPKQAAGQELDRPTLGCDVRVQNQIIALTREFDMPLLNGVIQREAKPIARKLPL